MGLSPKSADGDYPFYAAGRLAVSGMRRPRRFPLLSAARKERLVRAVRAEPLFPRHRQPRVRDITRRDVWRAALGAADSLVAFAAYLASLGTVLEAEPAGTFEWEILWFLRRLQAARHPVLRAHPGLRPVAAWARRVLGHRAFVRRHLRRVPPPPRVAPARLLRLLDTQDADGGWGRDPPVRLLPWSQADYLRGWLHATALGLLSLPPPGAPSS